jgi:hypothetical protein
LVKSCNLPPREEENSDTLSCERYLAKISAP